jgi:pyridoxamine-phosphate oxidase
MTEWLAGLRREHTTGAFADEDAHPDPFEQFRLWLGEAHASGILQANAMTLSTVDEHGHPDGRIVLLKGFDERGLVFYTHRTSRKGRQLAAQPHAALTFFWDILERQVRVLGSVEQTSDAESDEYFLSRPRGSQLGAIVSDQSAIIPDRDTSSRHSTNSRIAAAATRSSVRAAGAATASCHRSSNSGRDVRAACTIASGTCRTATATGRASAWLRRTWRAGLQTRPARRV